MILGKFCHVTKSQDEEFITTAEEEEQTGRKEKEEYGEYRERSEVVDSMNNNE